MSQDYARRLREIAETLLREADRIERAEGPPGRMRGVARVLTEAEAGRRDALRSALSLLEQGLRALGAGEAPPPPSAPPAVPSRARTGIVYRGEVELAREDSDPEEAGPLENSGLAGDDDTPGYGRGGVGG